MKKYFVDLCNGTTLYVEADNHEFSVTDFRTVLTLKRGTDNETVAVAINPISWGLVDCVEVQK